MTGRRPRVTVTFNPDGWPEESQPGMKLCGTQRIAPCRQLTVWRTQKRGRGYIATGYYCEEHLPAEARPQATGQLFDDSHGGT